MDITRQDLDLIDIASRLLKDNQDLYSDKDLLVGSAIRTKSGNVYKGVNICTSHSVCAEQVAIGQALANGEREFDTIVAVKNYPDNSIRVVSPCGLCRYIFDKLEKDFYVIVEDSENNKVIKVHVNDLLPYPYER